MTPVRVIGYDPDTKKHWQAFRGERNSKVWAWVEIAHADIMDHPDTAGDIVFVFPKGGAKAAPKSPPAAMKMGPPVPAIVTEV